MRIPGVVGEFIDVTESFGRPGQKEGMQKVLEFSRKLNNVVLSPMSFTEQVNRGIAFSAGMDEAARLGLNSTDAIRLSLAKASSMLPDIKLTESHYHAMLTAMKTQFGYDVAQIPPLLTSPLGRLSTLFLSYPVRQMEFVGKGIAQALTGYTATARAAGEAAAFASVDKAKLLRFMALTGFMASAPYFMQSIGIDASRIWGKGMLNLTFPFYGMLINGYNAVVGDDPVDTSVAKNKFFDAVFTSAVPQYRYLKSMSESVNRIERGFATDFKGRFLHETSPIGEVMKLAGFQPYEYAKQRDIARQLVLLTRDYQFERDAAIRGFILEKNPKLIEEFTNKWQHPITPEDLQRVMEEMDKSYPARAASGLPKDVRQTVQLQKPWLRGKF